MSKFQECVKISYGTAEGKFQIGQAGKDGNGNLFRFKGVSKEGVNVWLHVASPDLEKGNFKWRFGSLGFKNDLKRMRAAIKDKKPASSFGKGKLDFGKDVRQQFWLENDKGV